MTPPSGYDQWPWKGDGTDSQFLAPDSLASPINECGSFQPCSPQPLWLFDSSHRFNKTYILPGSCRGRRQAGALQSMNQARL